jgi:predicted Zn-dependent protease with MMP-like domain
MPGMTHGTRHDRNHIAKLARRAIAELPEPFRGRAREVQLRIADMPDAQTLRDLGLHDPMTLTGLYEGVPLTHKSVSYPSPTPDTIWLFVAPIMSEWHDRGDVDLADLVTNVVVHELAHFFGWSDDDIAAIDRWWE